MKTTTQRINEFGMKCLCLSALLAFNIASSAKSSELPEFHSDGRITCGSKSVQLAANGQIRLIIDDNELILIDQQMSLGTAGWTYPPNFIKKSFNVYPEKKTCVFTGKIPLSKEPNAPNADFELTVKLLDNGLINITRTRVMPANTPMKYDNTFFILPFYLLAGKSIFVDGKTVKIKKEYPPEKLIFPHKKNIHTLEFFRNNKQKSFKIDIEKTWNTFIRKSSNRENNAVIGLGTCDGTIRFSLDILGEPTKSTDDLKNTYAGINCWKTDHLILPNYHLSRNLIQNPSFEQGMRYFRYRPYAKIPATRYKWYYRADTEEAKFGKSSLLMRVLCKLSDPVPICTFIIPVEANQKYTFSFYAKTNQNNVGLMLRSSTAQHREWAKFGKNGKCYKYFSINKKWKRYHVTLTNPNTGLSLMFQSTSPENNKGFEGKVWIDGLQLEKGEAPTPYTEKPINAVLVTSKKDNFLDSKTPINAKLIIKTDTPDIAGKTKIEVIDFFNQNVWSGEFDFKTGSDGSATINLPLDEKLKNKKGIFIVKASFTLEDGFKDVDFFRLTIMDFLDNKFKNKNTFAFCLKYLLCFPDMPGMFERFRNIGWGSCNYGEFKDYIAELLKKFNITYFGEAMVRQHKANGNLSIGGKIKMRDINSITEVTPAIAKKFEDLCYEKAKFYSDINTWYFAGECATGRMSALQSNMDNFGKLLIATYKGVKRYNPNATVSLTGGPCNMMPQGGTKLIAKYIDAVKGKVKFDAVAIHPYRATPEDPDLDSDTAYLLKVLDKKGYGDVPVYWDEGMHFPQYNIPAWGLNPYCGNSNDHYYSGAPTYHMGWGEKIAAAFYARGWLVALKYQNRIKIFNGWQHRETFMDIDRTPFCVQQVTNTLGNILGNATFKRDIRFFPQSRCYVFEDELKRPVAAIWSYFPEVDRGKKAPPTAVIKFKDQIPEFIDLMNTSHNMSADKVGSIQIPLSSFPFFIRGKAGTMNKFCDALNNACIKSSKNNAIIKVAARPLKDGKLEISFSNPLTRPFNGKADINIAGEDIEKKLTLSPLGNETFIFPLVQKNATGKISKINFPCVVTENNGTSIKQNISFDFFTVKQLQKNRRIVVDGNLDDWQNIPAISVTNSVVNKKKLVLNPEKIGYPGDFGVKFKITWDTDNLYIAAMVTDDLFKHDMFTKTAQRWNNDCMQLYIDTLCDARSKTTKGFDTNDYDYDFFPDVKQGELTAYRRFAPEQQIAGGLFAPKANQVEPNIKTAFKKISGGYVYEIAIPKKYIAPMKLEVDSIVGLGLFFSDRDKGKNIKRSLTLTPEGTGCYMNPHLYPVMLLTK